MLRWIWKKTEGWSKRQYQIAIIILVVVFILEVILFPLPID